MKAMPQNSSLGPEMSTSKNDATPAAEHPVIFYDGVCALCNRMNQFVLRNDPGGIFYFASLQSPLGKHVLAKYGAAASDLDSILVAIHYNLPDEVLLSRSDAILGILQRLGGISRLVAALGRVCPKLLRDWIYNRIARNRYRVFGRTDSCLLPRPEYRDRFLDV